MRERDGGTPAREWRPRSWQQHPLPHPPRWKLRRRAPTQALRALCRRRLMWIPEFPTRPQRRIQQTCTRHAAEVVEADAGGRAELGGAELGGRSGARRAERS